MLLFHACRYPKDWYGIHVAEAAQHLEVAIWRYQRESLPVWKKAKRQTVIHCIEILRIELQIYASAEARHLRSYLDSYGVKMFQEAMDALSLFAFLLAAAALINLFVGE